jgi:hypothetical protein
MKNYSICYAKHTTPKQKKDSETLIDVFCVTAIFSLTMLFLAIAEKHLP